MNDNIYLILWADHADTFIRFAIPTYSSGHFSSSSSRSPNSQLQHFVSNRKMKMKQGTPVCMYVAICITNNSLQYFIVKRKNGKNDSHSHIICRQHESGKSSKNFCFHVPKFITTFGAWETEWSKNNNRKKLYFGFALQFYCATGKTDLIAYAIYALFPPSASLPSKSEKSHFRFK